MLPIGPMMIEHRLIEEMITLMADSVEQMAARQSVDPAPIVSGEKFLWIMPSKTISFFPL